MCMEYMLWKLIEHLIDEFRFVVLGFAREHAVTCQYITSGS